MESYIKMINRLRIFLGIIFLLITACYPVSHILVGDKRAPIEPSDVKIYSDYPEKYEKIAIIESGSDFAFKDPSFNFTDQKKTDKALYRLKSEAALLGANGLVIENFQTRLKVSFQSVEGKNGRHRSQSNTERLKEIIATAIFVE